MGSEVSSVTSLPLALRPDTGRSSGSTPSGGEKRMCTLAEARPPIDSGGPSATMRPAAMTTTRSARA